jgi:hypothetical protein
MSEDWVCLFFESKRLVQCQKAMPDGSLMLGGYSITYDREGKEISRTEPTWNVTLTGVKECLPWVYKAALDAP